jgi:hypothetical protein
MYFNVKMITLDKQFICVNLSLARRHHYTSRHGHLLENVWYTFSGHEHLLENVWYTSRQGHLLENVWYTFSGHKHLL